MKLSNKGFSLVEILVTFSIVAFCLSGILATYVTLFYMSDLARNTTTAINAVQAKMEEVRSASFEAVTAYAGTFDINGFSSADAKGSVEVGDINSSLRQVRVVACFKSRGKLIGDSLANCTSSPVELVTFVSK